MKQTHQQQIEALLNSGMPLEDIRKILKNQSYSDAFPTSLEAQVARDYDAALKQFDADHPEIVAEIIRIQKIKAAEKQEAAKKLGWI